jgi:hypothetical protein
MRTCADLAARGREPPPRSQRRQGAAATPGGGGGRRGGATGERGVIEREVDAPCSPLSVVVISEEREGSGHRGGEERRGREREKRN